MKHISSLTIFFPTLNDAMVLPSLIERARKAGSKVTDNFEIIIVNDGSTDNTSEIVESLQKKYPELRLVEHRTTQGYGAALRSGFTQAKKDYIFYTDGDGQYDPTELIHLVHYMRRGITVVNGYKLHRHDTWMRRVAGSIYNTFLHSIFSLPIRDIDCDFRLIKRSAFDHIRLVSTSGAICVELVLKLHKGGAKFREAAVHHYPRRFGHSQFFQLSRLGRTASELIQLWYYRYTL